MAKRVFQVQSQTWAAVADNTAMTNATYMAVGANSTTQFLKIHEIFMGGLATSSSPMYMQFARDLVLGTTPTALAAPNGDGPMNGATAALAAAPLTFVAAATGPSRTNTATTARLNLSFNAFGGLIFWRAASIDSTWDIIGQTVSISESTLSQYTGGTTAASGAHIIYEPM